MLNLPSNLLPEEWQREAFIAGGFAADPARACDIDVWVSVPVGNDLAGVRQELLVHLGAQRLAYQASVVRTIDENVSLGYSLLVGGELFLDNRQVATVTGTMTNKFPKPYHLIVTNGSVQDVLSGFDISTHQIAVTADGVVKGCSWTPVQELPLVIQNTPHTLDRWTKIEKRYRKLRRGSPDQFTADGLI